MKHIIKNKYILLVITAILLVGLFLRVLPAVQGTFAFTYDVGRDMLALQQIVVEHNIPLIGPTTGLGGLFYGPWWYYMLVPSFILFSGNPQGIVLFMALTGVLTVLLGFLLGKRIKNSLLGIILAALIAFSPLMVGLTTQIWNPNIAPLWLIGIIFLLFEIEKESGRNKYLARIKLSYIYYLVLGILLALSIDAEVVYGLLLNVAVSIYFFAKLLKKTSLIEIAALCSGFIFILLPRIIFEIRNNFLMTRTILNFAGGESGESFSFSATYNIANRFNFLLDFFGDTYKIQNLFFVLIIIVVCIVVLISNKSKLSNDQLIILQICAIIIAVYYVGLTLFNQDVWPHYIVGLPIIFIIITGIALNSIIERIGNIYITVALLVTISIILINPGKVYRDITNQSDTTNVAVYKNHLEIIDFIYKEANSEQFKYITYTPPVHDYTYKYLFDWYGKEKYGYIPLTSFKGLYFLIIEPDKEVPNRIENWLKVRSGDGVTTKEQSFVSGVRVQVRK